MVIIELIYKRSVTEVEAHLPAHRQFLNKYYDKGIFILSGPKVPRDGGVIIAKTDKMISELIINEDPFVQNDIAAYKILEFKPTKTSLTHRNINAVMK